ncbi:zinc carboxypeptidase [Roseivirga ehrenbergii]|uniref:Peptidase n=1 Tax=Roseivirga ehrenbergii (strain DSM 102268 / JCM 13514 / KCTC 12282 / NCIMB 14502 / KMM 6017) TaxID=279360 RepID=A0A150X0H6_ROSEK|nr:M14 family metallopeptidase [Roseivirga ehrenbergii]KYG72217.1 peptidase [Roseivirga ehrenbergii]TCL13455.1 zinc carboxypeptidase [Roseivirga ehrenbergii]
MNQKVKKWVLGALFLFSVSLQAQDYNNANQLAQRLKQLAGSSPDVKLESITKTDGGKDIWMLTLGKGDVDSKPAMAVVGGVEGAHILGVEMAVRFAEGIVKDHSSVLDHTTFYVFPNMSPDATEQYFASLKYERSGNAKQTDDDRDGKLNEDPFEDLNGDGIITWMRVEDATGDWVTHPADSRVMIKANKAEGEKGKYKIFTEGMDNDKDGSFNEDGEGGIHFRKNLTYEYPYFVAGAGEHSVSEKENRALLDLLYTKWNLYGVFTFGPGNNLSSPWRFNRAGASKRVVTSILSEDADLNKFISDAYNKTTGMKNAPASGEQGGDFLQWAYFHFGRLSLGTPGWWASAAKDEEGAVANKDKNQEVNFLRWAAQENLNNYFVDWKEISHPDFPNQKVEVGGIAPFKMNNPPMSMVADASKKNNDFIVELVGMQADVKLVNLKSEAVGKGMTRITVDVYNAGTLPTHTQMGTRSRWLMPIRVEVKLGKDQEVISGRRIMTINNLDGDGSQQFTWLVKGKGSVQIEAGAPHAGTDNVSVNLK